jgi:hypothetical protein
MGQISRQGSPGIDVNPIDRESGPGAGAGASGNRVIFLGAGTGQDSTASDMVLLGNAVMGDGVADLNAQYSSVVGSGSAAAMTDFTEPAVRNWAGPVVIVGGNNIPLVTRMPSSVLVGAYIGALLGVVASNQPRGANVFVGNNILRNAGANTTNLEYNVIIGYDAVRSSAGNAATQTTCSVIIGAQAMLGGTVGSDVRSFNVIVGYSAASSLRTGDRNVVIGSQANLAATSNDNVVIGRAASASMTNGVLTVAVGSGTNVSGSYATVLGADVTTGVLASGCVVLGYGALQAGGETMTDKFILETRRGDDGTRRCLLFGNLSSGSIIIGQSTSGTNRDMPGTNILKLLNGTITGAAPVGGGFFYVAAGALHWVGSANTDTVIAPA